jgi:hypothetical protein
LHTAELGRRGGQDDASTWPAWIQVKIGHLPIAKVTRDDVEALRDSLDEAISRHKKTSATRASVRNGRGTSGRS